MKKHIFFVILGSVMLVGAGCGRLQERAAQVKPDQSATDAQKATPVTRESVDLAKAELFLRSRDDIAPGQADVTNQTLFAKTPDGQLVELVADVHAKLGGALKADEYLVLHKQAPAASRYAYFTAGGGGALKPTGFFAFDKKEKTFSATMPVVAAASANALVPPQLSSDGARVAIFVQAEIEQKKSATVVYIGDLATGTITHRFVFAEKYKLSYAATKWVSTTEFKVGLAKVEGAEAASGKTFDVVNIDVRTIPSAVAADASYAWDAVARGLFGLHDDGYEIAVGPIRFVNAEYLAMQERDATAPLGGRVLAGVSEDVPYVYLVGPVGFGFEHLIAVYDKAAHEYLKEPEVPAVLRTVSSEKWVVSPRGDRVAAVKATLSTSTPAVVTLVDVAKVSGEKTPMVSKEIAVPNTVIARMQLMPDSDGQGFEFGKMEWLSNSKFSYEIFAPGKERAVAGSKAREIKNKLVGTEVIEFPSSP